MLYGALSTAKIAICVVYTLQVLNRHGGFFTVMFSSGLLATGGGSHG